MDEIIRKGLRLQKPREIKFSLRPCVFEWLDRVAMEQHCSPLVLARGLIEDAYDRAMGAAPNEEVLE